MSHYFPPIFACLFCIDLFHLLLINYFPQSKVFWKKVDYWWVSMGVIGIIGSTYSARKEHAVALQPWHKQSLELVYDEFEKSVTNTSFFFLDSSGFDYEQFEDKNQVRAYITAGESLQSIAHKTHNIRYKLIEEEDYQYTDSLTMLFQEFAQSVTNDFVLQNIQYPGFMLERIQEESNFLATLQNDTERNALDWILLFISPYLFAIAIALRLTKVTAELVEIKK